jgi:hypothetical protein
VSEPSPKPDPQRIAEVLRIRIDGAQLHDVVDYAAEKAWGITETECAALIRAADKLLARRMETNRRRLLARHIAQREALYARALNGADYGTAERILNDLAKLQGLFDKDHEREQLLQLATAQAERIAELEAMAEGRVIALEVNTNAAKDRPEEDACGPEEEEDHAEGQGIRQA